MEIKNNFYVCDISTIVNISSMSSERAGGSIAYCASKAGVDMLTKYMGKELGKYNIRVNSVNPVAVYTNIYITSNTCKFLYDNKNIL